MPKPWRHPNLPLVLRGQFNADPLAEVRRRLPKIDRHVEHRTRDHPHQLALRLDELVVDPAQHVPYRPRVVVLHELHIEPGGLTKRARVPALHEKTTVVAEYLRFKDQHLWQRGENNFHGVAY